MKIRSILLVLMFLMSCISFSAKAANKEEDYQKSYNYKRAVELLLNDQNESEAMRFFNAEIEDHKDNGYAYYWIALINENNELVINLEKKTKEEKKDENKNTWLRREFSYASYSQSFILPDDVQEDKIAAKMENGVLAITLPKKAIEDIKPATRQIQIL